ncbi:MULTISPECIES: hypothetical protein [Streptomyces]
MSEQRPTIDVNQFDKLCAEIRRVVDEGADGLSGEQCFESALNICEALGIGVFVAGAGAWHQFRAAGRSPDPNIQTSRQW